MTPSDEREAEHADDEKMYSSVPLTDEDGNEYVVRQQNVGPGNEDGGGEWPDPDAPARAPAPGSASDAAPEPADDQETRPKRSGVV